MKTTTRFQESLWRKSSRSGSGGNCVEIAIAPAHVGIRDTKNRTAGHLAVDRAAFAAFLSAVQ
ncbi:uncharacterized protein DUF397 [Tamaricihabitans halophyticus]|uniref:Uncharacterized protein DUF397 n=1 Tax=Tamaricihabitans halophyticus TaxID=1262583 RepID=A0A4R2Q6D5_9PSEU|nr:DUF397 domain-containing protein [Tamaricihabitans halophyticus]TCP43408.1 uncharacterized protein DUF397 [Tamaricihabitans halophyticus]